MRRSHGLVWWVASASNLADPVDHDILLIHELPCFQGKKGVTLGPSGEEAPAKQQLIPKCYNV